MEPNSTLLLRLPILQSLQSNQTFNRGHYLNDVQLFYVELLECILGNLIAFPVGLGIRRTPREGITPMEVAEIFIFVIINILRNSDGVEALGQTLFQFLSSLRTFRLFDEEDLDNLIALDIHHIASTRFEILTLTLFCIRSSTKDY